MPTVRFEPTISAGERPQTDALDRATTGIGPSGAKTPKIRQFLMSLNAGGIIFTLYGLQYLFSQL